jgi:AmmeMemoRadiSam system protein A
MTMLTARDRTVLLHAARDALRAALSASEPQVLPEESRGVLGREGASFVTWRRNGDLRGCVGTLEAREPLSQNVRRMAVMAALHDGRFPPIEASELEALDAHVNVLGPPTPIDPAAIEIGRHGLLIERGPVRGVLLPEVASERGWTPERLIAETCHKAGLAGDAWRDPDTQLYGFETDSFGTDDSH